MLLQFPSKAASCHNSQVDCVSSYAAGPAHTTERHSFVKGRGEEHGSGPWQAMMMTVDVQVPVVIRGPGGVGRQLGTEHSQRLESHLHCILDMQLEA